MDKNKKKWFEEMKEQFTEAEEEEDLVPDSTEEALDVMPPEVWDAIVSGKIDLKRGLPPEEMLKKHGEMRPVFDFLAGQPVHERLTKGDVKKIMKTQEAENRARLLMGLMEAVGERGELPEEGPAEAANYIRGSLAKQHRQRGIGEKIKDFLNDVVDFVGNALAVLLGF